MQLGFLTPVRCGIAEKFKILIGISLPNKRYYCLIPRSIKHFSQFSAILHQKSCLETPYNATAVILVCEQSLWRIDSRQRQTGRSQNET